jgi:two-component system, OmpR family, response regulator RegX3
VSGEPVVLVVEDEPSFVEALAVGLTREGFVVKAARDGEEALTLFEVVQPDLVLLDVMLPKLSGLEVLRHIRRTSATPVIMLTAKSSEVDLVVGLEIGADDYVTKPYRLRELVARMRSVLRRSTLRITAEPAPEDGILAAGDVTLDIDRHQVLVRGEEVRLPLKEFELLELLLTNAGRVMTRDVLLTRVWGPHYGGDAKTLDVHIKRLRSKVEVNPSVPQQIITIRGLGYLFEPARRRTTFADS